MKRYKNKINKHSVGVLGLVFLCLTGCSKQDTQEQWRELAFEARTYYSNLEQATALCHVTADYGQRVYDFTMEAQLQREVEGLHTTLTLTAPEELVGVAVTQIGNQSQLLWEDLILETGTLAEQSPITVLPSLLQQLEQGYIQQSVVKEMFTTQGSLPVLYLYIQDPDTPTGQGLSYELWLRADTLQLLGGDIYQDGLRVLRCALEEFVVVD